MGITAVLMAGGKGTRIANLRADIPKPMLEICGKPVLERQILCLRENQITDIVLVIGHLGQIIRNYFGDGAAFGVKIRYIQEESPLGTAGALFYLRDLQDAFFLINGDIVFDIDLMRMYRYHMEKRAAITLFAHPNDHPYDSTLLSCEDDGRVTAWEKSSGHAGRNLVNAGIHILSPEVLQPLHAPIPHSLDRDVISAQIGQGTVYAYRSSEYVHDMGTPERYRQVCGDVASGVVARRNFKQRQRAIFLDRDGTINANRGYITSPDQISLLPGAAKAIRTVNRSGYLAIVVTNQPVIARGDCTPKQLRAIHGHLEYLLGKEGAYLDDIFYCPHHPDRGFPGEVAKYKVACTCRKPQPGLLLQAAEQYHIDLTASYIIGDSERDVQAGQAAGCTGFLLQDGGPGAPPAGNLFDVIQTLFPQSAPHH